MQGLYGRALNLGRTKTGAGTPSGGYSYVKSGGASYPQIESASSGATASGTNHVITYPSGVANGSLVIGIFTVTNTDMDTVTWPVTFTALEGDNNQYTIYTTIGYRRCDGSEGANFTITTNAAGTGSYVFYRISGHHGTSNPESANVVTLEDAAPNPASITASWGSAKNLFIAFAGTYTDATFSGYPASYDKTPTGSGGYTAVAGREVEAATEDPGTFTLSTDAVWGAYTVVIRPSS